MNLSFSEKRKLQKQLVESQKALKAGGLTFSDKRSIQKTIKSVRASLGMGRLGNQGDLNKLSPDKFKAAVNGLDLSLSKLKRATVEYIGANLNESNIITIGKGKKKQKSFIPILTRVMEFFLDELMGSSSAVAIKLSFEKLPRGHYGNTVFQVGEKKKFNLQLSDNVSFDMMLIGLAHELTHIAQVAKGELVFKTPSTVEWRGSELTIDSSAVIGAKDFDFKAYQALPWEKEARRNESRLVAMAKVEFKGYHLPDMEWATLFE